MKKHFLATLAIGGILVSGTLAKTLATVDGEKITSEEISTMLTQVKGAPKFETLSDEIKKKLIDQTIQRKLLIKAAFDDKVAQDSEFKKALKAVKDNIGLEVWMKRKLENISVNDKEAKDFYNENKAQMTRPEQVKASHILLKDEAKAKEVIAELKKVSSSDLKSKFQEAARKYSTGPSASKGGDLGIFGKGQMVKPFSDAAFGLGDNKMTLKPIKTQFGWHIIYVEKNIKGGTVSFADVKPQMIEGAKRKKFKNLIDLKVKALKKKAKIIYSK